MPAVVRLGDVSTGHPDGYPSRPSTGGSPDVYVNGKKAHRVGDSWATHSNGDHSHGGSASSGSSNIFVNGKALCRVGDKISCGDTMATGSPNVIAN